MNTTTLTASSARTNFFDIIRQAGQGLQSFEITIRGGSPAILISKDELESWQETLDIMSNPEEVEAIAEGLRNPDDTISLDEVLQQIDNERNASTT